MVTQKKSVNKARSGLMHRATLCIILFFLPAAAFIGLVYRRTSVAPGQCGASGPSLETTANQEKVDAGNLDRLLDLADKDVGQLSRVKVTKNPGAASIGAPVNIVARTESSEFSSPRGKYPAKAGFEAFGQIA